MLPFIIAGLATGAIYGLAAFGLVLTYKTSGIFNFSQGALASASAFLFYFLNVQLGLSWPVAALLCVFVFGPLLGLTLELIARRLSGAPATIVILGTVGILLAIQGTLDLIYPPGPIREVPQFLPDSTVSLAGTQIAWSQIITFVFAVAVVGGLTVYLRRARVGLAMSGVVDSPELLGLTGQSPAKVRRVAWIIGTTLASASGVLIAPLVPLDSTTMTMLVVTAFGAAAIGAFSNLPLSFVGGLIIGVGQAILQKYFVQSTGVVSGLATALPFLVLFALLVAAPRLRPPSRNVTRREPRPRSRPWQLQVGAAVVLFVLLSLAPAFAGEHLTNWTRMLGYTVVFLSLGLLVKVSGQVSLAHITFMAIGVAAFVHIAVANHWPWALGLVVAAIVAAPVGAVLSIPAIRFPGVYLALATLGFGILVQQMFYFQPFMFGSLGVGVLVPTPTVPWLGDDPSRSYYYVCLFVLVVVAALIIVIERSVLGKMLAAMKDSPTGLASAGASINVTRVLVFSLASGIAAIGGVLDAGALGIVGGDSYPPILSMQLFAVLLLVVGPSPWYAVLAAAGQVLIPSYLSLGPTVNYIFTVVFGLSAIMIAIGPSGPPALFKPLTEFVGGLGRNLDRFKRSTPARADKPKALPARTSREPITRTLNIDGLTVRFGGLVAVKDVDLASEPGKIVGLIGPNGAGKSTIFNASTGLVTPTEGTVTFGGKNLRRLAPPARARLGLGRTFQQMQLFDSLSVAENIRLGAAAANAGWNPVNHLVTGPRKSAEVRARADEAIELCGLRELADETVANLSTGHRRLVELARCAAGDYDVLLLDEPSSGLDRTETRMMGDVMLQLVAERGMGLLLVEHDMALVNRVCDYVHVIDFGEKIFQGTVSEVATSSVVRRAYLGEELVPAGASSGHEGGGN